MSRSSLAPGFGDPVLDSQHAFRRIMDAFARPGGRQHINVALGPPAPRRPAAAAAVLTLCDYETPLHLSATLASQTAVVEFLRFHSGAPIIADPSRAAFALVDLQREPLTLSDFAQGAAEYPDRSTTVIVIVPDSASETSPLPIVGPGIATVASLAIPHLPADFAAQWQANRARYPLGVDLLFASGASFVGLPRTTRILSGGA